MIEVIMGIKNNKLPVRCHLLNWLLFQHNLSAKINNYGYNYMENSPLKVGIFSENKVYLFKKYFYNFMLE